MGLRHVGLWCLMLLVAIANGGARDLLYGDRMSELAAHQLSTAIGMVLLGALMWGFCRRHPPASDRAALAIGVFWMSLTVAFECLFFHFVAGHPWSALLANYDLSAGRIWVLLLLWVALAPSLFFRLQPKGPGP
ncbi:hypothetical protein G3580_12880 [Nitrogeniibacter mangrovi]|uniref:Uncharacterized protein n=1 Tax=Nitrogeniibacter mangrovi TaxID=2016596 RepID=A0A6C1B816_9RHOO|nr:hypothetical protein G3580_12880 [Nitrogeniibacter mangrovi]